MKNFLVINTSYFGDVLLTDSLCRNIKAEYPDAKLIFMVNKPFADAAEYMDGVDQVIIYDKRGKNKGLAGLYQFYKQHKSLCPVGFDAAFVIYGNERGIVLAKLLGSRKIYSDNNTPLRILLANNRIDYGNKTKAADKHTHLFELYTKKPVKNLPIQYNPPASAKKFAAELLHKNGIKHTDKLVALCTTSKRRDKDMRLAECIKLINYLNEKNRKVIFLGAGQVAVDYTAALQQQGCTNFIDLTNKTTIAQLAAVAQQCSSAVSVDTGTMHLLYALKIPLVAVFYLNSKAHLAAWTPPEGLPCRVIAGPDFSAENMLHMLAEVETEAD